LKAKFIYEYLELPPKSKEQILKDLSLLPKEELNKMLLYAVEEGSLNKIRYLLAAEADANVKDKHGWTALMWAA
jgi:ankyrin repeat protein